MLIWGLIMAKAKAGYTAATSKDNKTVTSQYKNIFTILVLVVVATVAQIKFESGVAVVSNNEAPVVENKGRNLAMVNYETEKEDIEIIDYRDLLHKAA